MQILLITGLLLFPAFASAQDTPERWTLVEELRIGRADGPHSLTTVHPMTVSPDGRHIYVGQRTENLIRVFDASSGALIHTFGRPGSGPGEFRNLTQMGWKQDTLYVVDFALQQASLFLPDGTHLRTDRITSPRIPGVGVAIVRGYLSNGTAIGAPNYGLQAAANGDVTSVPWVQMRHDGTILRTLGERYVGNTAGVATLGGRIAVFLQPMSETPFLQVAPDGSSVVLTRAVTNVEPEARFEVTRIDAEGDTIYHRRFRYTPRPLSRSEIDDILDRAEKMFPEAPPARAREAVRTALKLPPAHPPFLSVTIGPDGSTWLGRGEIERGFANWLVLSPSGEIRATLQAPEGVSIKAVSGDAVWGVLHDNLDIPYVVRYRVRRVTNP